MIARHAMYALLLLPCCVQIKCHTTVGTMFFCMHSIRMCNSCLACATPNRHHCKLSAGDHFSRSKLMCAMLLAVLKQQQGSALTNIPVGLCCSQQKQHLASTERPNSSGHLTMSIAANQESRCLFEMVEGLKHGHSSIASSCILCIHTTS